MVAEDKNDALLAGFTEIKEWLKTKEHLPQLIDDVLLMRYVHCVRGDMERAKKILEKSFIMRSQSPHIFLDRDPLDPKMQSIFAGIDMIPLPVITDDNHKIIVFRLTNTDPDLFEFNPVINAFFMAADVRLAKQDPGEVITGEIPIFDMTGFTLRHLTKVVLSTLRIYMKYTQEVHPIRLKHIHIINCTTFLDRLVMVIKPFIKGEVFKLIQFHTPNSDTLNKFIAKEYLPIEYGGTACSLVDLKSAWRKDIDSNRDYLMDPRRWRLNDLKAKEKNNNDNVKIIKNNKNISVVKNFRSLEID